MTQHLQSLWTRILALCAVGTVTMWVISVLTLVQAVGRPFPGFIVEPPLFAASLHAKHWPSHQAGLTYLDRLLTANGQPLKTVEDLDRLVASVPIGTPITYEYLQGGQTRTMTVPTQRLSAADAVEVLLPWVLVGSTYLWVGIIAFCLNPRLPAVRAHLVLCLAMSLVENGMMPFLVAHTYPYPFVLSLPFMGAGYLHLALTFPKVPAFVQRRPYLIPTLIYLPALVMAGTVALRFEPAGYLGNRAAHEFYIGFLQQVYASWSGVGMIAFLLAVLYATWRAPDRLARQQAGIVLVGALLTVGLTMASYFLPVLLGATGPIASKIEWFGQAMLPITIAYAILRHRLFDIERIIRRGTLYVGLTLVLAGIYVLGAVTGNLLIGRYFGAWSGASLPGFVAALAVAMAFRPLHDSLRHRIDRLFLGERADALQSLAEFGQQPFPNLQTYAQKLVTLIERSLAPRWVRLVRDGQVLAASGSAPEGVAELTLPLVAGQERQGELAIGPRRSEIPYGSDEKTLLRVLAAHAAVALQAGHLIEEQFRLRVSEGVARSLAAERESLLRQVVHDVRSDLFNINMTVHLGKHLSDEEASKSIAYSMERIESLLDEKIRQMIHGPEATSCRLQASLQGATATMAGLLPSKAQTLALSLPEADVTVPLSAVAFGQIVTNLLTNAHKFAPAGTTIGLEVRIDRQDLWLTVSDEGPGIPPELLETPGSGKRGHPDVAGHGMGLQIVDGLLRGVGGRLSWHNGPKGAVVQAIIPLAATPAAAILPEHPEGPSACQG